MPVLLVLVLLHLYLGVRLVPALPTAAGIALGLWLVLQAVLIPVAFYGRRAGNRALADRLSWAGMGALGSLAVLLVLTLLREALLLAAWPLAAWLPAWLSAGFPAGLDLATTSARAVPLLAVLALGAGLLNARRTARVRTVEVPVAGLPAALQGFTIAQISDIHVGPTVKRGYLQAIVDAVNRLDADAVAITGDLVDGRVQDLQHDVAPLAALRSRHGSFFVTGNHEYYSGALEWMALLTRLGLRVLTNEHVVLQHGGARLVLAGVADWSAHRFVPAHRSDPARALAGAPADAGARVLLAHQPRSAEGAAAAGFHVQLSGHTHGGQIWPFNFFVPLQQPFTAGLRALRRGAHTLWVYTSRGTGYWGPPLRLGAPSEITRLRLVAA